MRLVLLVLLALGLSGDLHADLIKMPFAAVVGPPCPQGVIIGATPGVGIVIAGATVTDGIVIACH
jgi:hypothetical protein